MSQRLTESIYLDGLGVTFDVYLAGIVPAATEAAGPAGGAGAVDPAGNPITGTPGVPTRPASHGKLVWNAVTAKGQSCLPGCATTAQSMPN